MEPLRITGNDAEWSPKYYGPIVGLFCALYMMTQALTAKMFTIGIITTSASIIIFPLCCIITDILTEVYGFNRARRALWTVLVCTFLFAFFSQIVLWLPSASFWSDQEAFEKVFAIGPRIAVAGACAWMAGELINSLVMSKMKITQNARGTAIRFISSTIVGQAIDTAIFFTIAFAGTMAAPQLLQIAFTSWCIKVGYEIIMLPLSVPAAKWAKRLEGVEHFDRQKISAI